jgi:hypothetical protein
VPPRCRSPPGALSAALRRIAGTIWRVRSTAVDVRNPRVAALMYAFGVERRRAGGLRTRGLFPHRRAPRREDHPGRPTDVVLMDAVPEDLGYRCGGAPPAGAQARNLELSSRTGRTAAFLRCLLLRAATGARRAPRGRFRRAAGRSGSRCAPRTDRGRWCWRTGRSGRGRARARRRAVRRHVGGRCR